ncbi:unnamed protein product [Caenorhabditis brenneri]
MEQNTPDPRKESLLASLINAEEARNASSSHQMNDLRSSGPINPDFFRIMTNSMANSNSGVKTETEEEEEKPYLLKCEHCDLKFTKRNNYSRHMNSHTLEKQFICRFCPKFYLRKDQWRNHLMSHMKTGFGFDCPVNKCVEHFVRHGDLCEHLETSHVITQDSPAECKICLKVLEKPERLLVHYQTEHEEIAPKMKSLEPVRPSFDDLAIQKSPQKAIKKRPRAKSMGVRLIKQEVKDEDYMVDEKPLHSCDVCHKSFSTSGNLSRHRRTHLDLMPFECRMCHKTFMRQYQLATHMRTHNRRKIDSPVEEVDEMQEVEQDDVATREITPAEAPAPEKPPELVPIDSNDNSLVIDDGDDDQVPVEEVAPEESTTFYFADGIPAVVQRQEPSQVPEAAAVAAVAVEQPSNTQTEELKCEPCGLAFNDTTLFVIHRIFHSPEHPFKCGMCKNQFNDKYQFTLHLLFSRDH